MKYLKFTHVDSVTGISVAAEPARNGPGMPPVVSLQFVWARESAYPTNAPELFGTCPDTSDTQIDGVLALYVQSDWAQMHIDEMNARPKPPGLQDVVTSATQARLDAFAQTRNYDGILSACTYASSTVLKFAKEGQYAVNARDATWSALYTLLGEVQAGTKPAPDGFKDVEPLLPVLVWPA
jgi:hypothetical protein